LEKLAKAAAMQTLETTSLRPEQVHSGIQIYIGPPTPKAGGFSFFLFGTLSQVPSYYPPLISGSSVADRNDGNSPAQECWITLSSSRTQFLRLFQIFPILVCLLVLQVGLPALCKCFNHCFNRKVLMTYG
jgi:hypothetical protein